MNSKTFKRLGFTFWAPRLGHLAFYVQRDNYFLYTKPDSLILQKDWIMWRMTQPLRNKKCHYFFWLKISNTFLQNTLDYSYINFIFSTVFFHIVFAICTRAVVIIVFFFYYIFCVSVTAVVILLYLLEMCTAGKYSS